MIDDSDLLPMVKDIDTFILRLCDEYKCTPLLLSSVILARCTLLNDSIGSGQDFRKLMLSSSQFDNTMARNTNSFVH